MPQDELYRNSSKRLSPESPAVDFQTDVISPYAQISRFDPDCDPHRNSPTEGAVSFTGQIYPNNTVGYFRIASVTGRQPIEPVGVGEFLIGSAAHCHLRFGDDGIPAVHTTLHVDREIVLLRSSTTDPPVLVNGQPETECRLSDGDMLELGKHRLLFRLSAAEHRITLNEDQFAVPEAASQSTNIRDASNAQQLVERLEEQLDLVEELTHSPDDGMLELLKAVAETGESKQLRESSQLQEVKLLIQKNQEASRIRLESLTAVLDNVVRQQKLIADTLEVLSDRIQSMDTAPAVQQRRVSA